MKIKESNTKLAVLIPALFLSLSGLNNVYAGTIGECTGKGRASLQNPVGKVEDTGTWIATGGNDICKDKSTGIYLNEGGGSSFISSQLLNASQAYLLIGDTIKTGQGEILLSAPQGMTFSGTSDFTKIARFSAGADMKGNKLLGIAPGEIEVNSTDAVNGSQLYAFRLKMDDLDTRYQGLSGQYVGISDRLTDLKSQLLKMPVLQVNGTGTATGKNSSAWGKNSSASGKDSTATGYGSVASGSGSTATGVNSKATALNSSAFGTGASAEGNNSTALGAFSRATHNNSVALGANSTTTSDNTVSVGSRGAERQITNVAPGTRRTDAVNLGQLNNAMSNMSGNISRVNRRAMAGTSAAMAVAGLPQPGGPGMSMISAAGSTYGGQNAVALGISYVTDNNKWVLKVAANSSSMGQFGATAGAGFQW